LYHPVEWQDAIEQFRNLPPLGFGLGTRADLVANILLFVPLTFFWHGATTRGRSQPIRLLAGGMIISLAVAAAFALEFTQIWFAGRTVTRNDIVAESAGGIIGVVLWLAAGERAMAWLARYRSDRRPRSQLVWLLQAYTLGLLIYSVIPLDLTISVTELYDKYQDGKVLLVPFSYSYASPSTVIYQFFADVMTFVPVGAWLALTDWHRKLARSPLVGALIGSAVIAVIVEFAQLLVVSRFTDVTDILLGTAGAGLGALFVARFDRSSSQGSSEVFADGGLQRVAPWVVALAVYSAFVAVGLLFPFEFTTDRALIERRLEGFLTRIPLLALYLGDEFNAIKQTLIRLLVFVPVGVLWAFLVQVAYSRVLRWLLTIVAVVHAAGLALFIELVQVLMPARIADLTEVGLCTIGAIIGLSCTSRILRSRDSERYQSARASGSEPHASRPEPQGP
jgi:glycopeptide antibiotics resistance protein